MNLNDLNSESKDTKPWLNIIAHSVHVHALEADIATIDDLEVVDLSADLLTLNNQLAVPNAPINSTSFFSSGSGNLSQTDELGTTVTYTTAPPAGAYVVGTAPSVVGNLPEFDNITADGVSDSGIASANVFLADGSVLGTGNFDLNNNELKGIEALRSFGTNYIFSNSGTVGINNVAIGANALNVNTQSGSVAIGSNAMGANTTGPNNAAVGTGALASNTTGAENSAFGSLALNSNTTSNSSSAFGRRALLLSTGAANNAFGVDSLINVTSGFSNSGFGANSLLNIATGNRNVGVGVSATPAADQSNTVSIGVDSAADANGAIVISNGANPVSNTTANSLLFGDALTNIRPNNSSVCDLGVSGTNRFNNAYLNGCLIGSSNRPVDVGLFSQYADVNINNTVVETTLVSGTAVGSLLFNPTPLGALFDFSVSMLATSAAGDTLDIRWYSNAGILFTNNLTIPALAVNLPVTIKSYVIVRNGNIYVTSTSEISGVVATIVGSAIVYDRTINNTWNVTAQWGANVNQLSIGMLNVRSSYSGTA